MELYQLRTFITIASLGSFTQSADVLGYAQSSISEHIKSLETELKTPLLIRSGNKQVLLTAAGETLLNYAQKMLNLETEIKSEVKNEGEGQGSITIRAPETVSIHIFPGVINRFLKNYARVTLAFMNCAYFDLAEELKTGVIDLGFLITDSFQMHDLKTEILGTIPLAMVTYPQNPLAGDKEVKAAQLIQDPLIVPANDCSYIRMLERILAEQKVELPLVWRFNSIEAIKQVIMNGTGFSVLPEMMVKKEIEEGKMIVLPWNGGLTSANLLMVWQKNKWLPPALLAFMHEVRREMGTQV